MDHYVKSVSEYVEIIDELRRQGRHDQWFRGIGSLDFKLVPGLIWRKNALQNESSLVHRFLVSYKAYGDFSRLNDWEKYALMQHHGLPTRLLDWTENPLVALYFALHQESEDQKEDCAVWAMDPYHFNHKNYGVANVVFCPSEMNLRKGMVKFQGQEEAQEQDLDRLLPPNLSPYDTSREDYFVPPLAINASYGSSRIRSQKGCFTIHGSDLRPIDDYFRDDTDQISRIIISFNGRPEQRKRQKERVRYQLYDLGITHEFIYQDLDSLSQRIMQDFRIP